MVEWEDLRWWDTADARRVLPVAEKWWNAAVSYVDSDGSESAIEDSVGSLGQFGSYGQCLAVWLEKNGIPSQPYWDAFDAIEMRLDGDSEAPTIRDISRLLRQASFALLLVTERAYGELRKPRVPAVRLTPTDKKILAVIDEFGSVAGQTDLLNKMADGGEIIDIGTVKPRLAEMKASGVLVAVSGNRGYRRP